MLVSIPGLNDDNLKLYHKMVNNFNTSLKQLMWVMVNLKITLAVNCRDFYLNHSPSTLLDLNKKKLRASSFLGKDLFGEVVLEKGLDDSNLEVKRRCDQALLSHVFKQSENIPSAVMQQPSSVQKQQPSVQTEVFAGRNSLGAPRRRARGGRTSQGSGAGRGSGSTSGVQSGAKVV